MMYESHLQPVNAYNPSVPRRVSLVGSIRGQSRFLRNRSDGRQSNNQSRLCLILPVQLGIRVVRGGIELEIANSAKGFALFWLAQADECHPRRDTDRLTVYDPPTARSPNWSRFHCASRYSDWYNGRYASWGAFQLDPIGPDLTGQQRRRTPPGRGNDHGETIVHAQQITTEASPSLAP